MKPNGKKSNVARSAQGLRDALFAEIEELRSGEGNPSKAMAVAKLAQQIISSKLRLLRANPAQSVRSVTIVDEDSE